MERLREVCDTVFNSGTAVLMARIVDTVGVCVRRHQVAAIGYSIYELDRRDPNKRKPVRGHDRIPLEVDEVFLDYLKTGEPWGVDVAGYNFCHKLAASSNRSFPKRGAVYEICYLFITTFGDPVIVQIFVRVISK
jgi:hypothetical protein